jgi:peptidoglycan biosynthesis protein MviN/MurJ (putative lipid II flippase)
MQDPASQHRQIAAGFFWVALFVFIGKLAGAAKEMAIAWRYGVSATVDAYVLVVTLLQWPIAIWSSVLTVILLPLVARLRHEAAGELPRFRAELLGLTLVLGLGMALLAWLGLPTLLRAGWLGLSGPALTKGLEMAPGLALLAPLGTAVGLFSASLLASRHHRNTLFEAIPALALLVALLLPPGWLPEPLVWGTVAGVALQAAALGTPLHRAGDLSFPRFSQDSPAWHSFWTGIWIVAIGQVLFGFNSMIDQFFAAGLGEGAISTLSYANRILALMTGLATTAISRATLPVFSTAQAGSTARANTLALHWARTMLVLSLLGSALAWGLAPWIVNVLFLRGAFTPESAHDVAQVLRLGLLQVPAFSYATTLVSLVAAQKNYRVLMYSGITGLATKAIVTPILVHTYRLNGLILSSFFVYLFNSIYFHINARSRQ